MKIAMLAPIGWQTPPEQYGPWERVVSLLTEGLTSQGIDVTLFATSNSKTSAKLESVVECGYREDTSKSQRISESLHISHCFERAEEFDLIHNHLESLPLTYSRLFTTPLVTTIYDGIADKRAIPVYQKYSDRSQYVSVSNSDRLEDLDYFATVHNGIDVNSFTHSLKPNGKFLLYFGQIRPTKGTAEAIEIARKTNHPLVIAGTIENQDYFTKQIQPQLDDKIKYLGAIGPEMKNTLLGDAHALLRPSLTNDSFSLSVVEAMACGTPVIAYNKGSMNEIITHGEDGFIARDMHEAVDFVAKIPEINRETPRRKAELKFSAERMVKDYIRVYEGIIAGHVQGHRNQLL